MTLRPRPAFTLALATALAGSAPLPAAADDPPEPTVQGCYTQALTAEEVEAGVLSEIECFEVPADAPMARRAAPVIAVLYDVSNTSGDWLSVEGYTCTGAFINLSVSDPWNNRASATSLTACGNAKHYTGGNFTGTNELKTGIAYHTFSGAMNNSISSVEYSP